MKVGGVLKAIGIGLGILGGLFAAAGEVPELKAAIKEAKEDEPLALECKEN